MTMPGKTYRKPYRQSRAFDASCRCHGGCPYCENSRTYQARRERTIADEKIREIRGAHADYVIFDEVTTMTKPDWNSIKKEVRRSLDCKHDWQDDKDGRHVCPKCGLGIYPARDQMDRAGFKPWGFDDL